MVACEGDEDGSILAGALAAATAPVEDNSGPAATALPVAADALRKLRRVESKVVMEAVLNRGNADIPDD